VRGLVNRTVDGIKEALCLSPFNPCWAPYSAPERRNLMFKLYIPSGLLFLGLAILSFTPAVSAAGQNASRQRNDKKIQENLVKEVRHQLLLLPYYSVFDNLLFKVDGDKVTLMGQVVRPTLKSDAESAVKSIEAVASVDNQIEVLPVSPMDDQLRRAVFRAIYADPALSRYGMSALPSIHIIVKNGHVTLEGVVDSESDRNLANLRANAVPNVFSVSNNLTVPATAEKK
jgi:hyperosmotically inducible periplasmic protein